LGRSLLEHSPFGAVPTALGNHYWVVLMDLDRYAVAGGLVLGMVCGGVLASMAWRLTRDAHRRLSVAPADDFSLNRISSRILFDVLGSWLVIKPSDIAAPSWRCRWRSKWLLTVPMSLILAILILSVAVPRAIEQRVLDELTRINGAPVTASRIEVSLNDREIHLQDVRFADPVDPSVERLRVGRAKARLRVPAIALRGIWHLEHVVLDDIRVDETPATIDHDEDMPSELPEGAANASRRGNSTGTVDLPLARHAPRIVNLVQYMSRVESMAAIGRRIAEVETSPTLASESWWERREALWALRSHLRGEQPRVVIDQLWVKQLPASWRLGPTASLRMEHLASRVPTDHEPTKLKIDAPAVAMHLQAALRLNGPGEVHDVRCQFSDLRLVELIGPVANEDRLTAYGGQLSINIEGHVLGDTIDLHAKATADKPRLRVLGQEPWCGVSPAVWNRGFVQFDSFTARFRVFGTWERPVLRVDQHQLRQQLKQQLAARGWSESGSESDQPEGASEAEVDLPRMAEDGSTAPAETQPAEHSTADPETLVDRSTSEVPPDLAASDMSKKTTTPVSANSDHAAVEAEADVLDTNAMPSHSDHATDPLLVSEPNEAGAPTAETAPPQPPVTAPRVSEQPLETASIDEPKAAVDNFSGPTPPTVNPLRPAKPAGQLSTSLPTEVEPTDIDASNSDSLNTYGIADSDANDKNDVDEPIALPESLAEDAPGLIDFDSGYDQSRVADIDQTAVDSAAVTENRMKNAVEPPKTRELPKRKQGRLARWSRSFSKGVRKLWSGSRDSDESIVSGTPPKVEGIDVPSPTLPDNEPILQAHRPTPQSDIRPWYRRLW